MADATLTDQLLQAGLVSPLVAEQVESAQADHLIGSLVTHGVREDALTGFFVTRGYGPVIEAEELEEAERRAVRAIPGRLATRLCALPFRTCEGGVQVAMADPTDKDAVVELQETMGERVVIAVARWSVLRDAIAGKYANPSEPPAGADPEVVELKRRRHPEGALPLVRSKGQVTPSASSGPYPPSDSTSEVWDQAWATRESGDQSAALADIDLGPKLATLTDCDSRDAVVTKACEIVADDHRAAIFLAVRKGVLTGWAGAGPETSEDAVRSLHIPTGSPSVMGDVLETRRLYHGPWGHGAADQLLKSAMGSRHDAVSVAAVTLKARAVGVVCLDGRNDGQTAQLVADAVAEALMALLRRRSGG